jgi:hypothetical protein
MGILMSQMNPNYIHDIGCIYIIFYIFLDLDCWIKITMVAN